MVRRFQTLLLAAAVAAQDIRTATHGVSFDEPLSDRPPVQPKKMDPPSAPEVQIQFNMPPLNLTALGHHAGEAAVGASAGAVAAWLVHRIQSTIVLIGVLGSVSTAAAVHMHWVSLEQVRTFSFLGGSLLWLQANTCFHVFFFSAMPTFLRDRRCTLGWWPPCISPRLDCLC